MKDEHERVNAAMSRINEAWVAGRVEDLAEMVHPDIVMVLPGFGQRIQGRETFLAGFSDFSQNAMIHQFQPAEHQIDVVGDTAVVTFEYVMIYERSGEQSRVTGRELWIFAKRETAWIAVWRTMLNLNETAA